MRRLAPLPLIALLVAAIVLSLGGAPQAEAGRGESELLAPRSACKGQLNPRAPVRVQERAMRCLINYARAKRGLSRLRNHGQLLRAADAKAHDIIRCKAFSHTACGRPVSYWAEMTGYAKCSCSWAFGENIAWGGASRWDKTQSARNLMNAWLHSPDHKRNILDPKWRDQGVGLVKKRFGGFDKAVVWVSHFGVRNGA